LITPLLICKLFNDAVAAVKLCIVANESGEMMVSGKHAGILKEAVVATFKQSRQCPVAARK
jgi:hypothetical protein